jgi:hypothetical protein
MAAHDWAAEFACNGEVRIPPRRRVYTLRSLMFGLLLANQIGSVVSAALDREPWQWWPLFALVSTPLFAAMLWISVRATLFGRPVLEVDNTGVSLGRKHLAWNEIKTIEGPGIRRRRPADPRRPVNASREWSALLSVVPTTKRRRRQIVIGTGHVKEVASFAAWLDTVRRLRQTDDKAA